MLSFVFFLIVGTGVGIGKGMDRAWLRYVCMSEGDSCVYELCEMVVQMRVCNCLVVSPFASIQNCDVICSCVLLVNVQSVGHFWKVPQRECKGELFSLLCRGKSPLVISENLNII